MYLNSSTDVRHFLSQPYPSDIGESVSPKTKNDTFRCFWRLVFHDKVNYLSDVEDSQTLPRIQRSLLHSCRSGPLSCSVRLGTT
jgi:hypothetical protein